MHVNDLLKVAVERGASDLHLKAGSYPMMRVGGELTPVAQDRRIDHDEMIAIAAAVLPTALREKFKESHEVDLAYSVAGLGRFRCNAFQQRGTIGMTFRVIPFRVATIPELTLPPVLKRITQEQRGLVLVTGTTGSGKSTTLAAMIDEINSSQTVNVMTIEDPIEYSASRQAFDHLSARGWNRHEVVCAGASERAPTGPGCDSGRRNARPRDD